MWKEPERALLGGSLAADPLDFHRVTHHVSYRRNGVRGVTERGGHQSVGRPLHVRLSVLVQSRRLLSEPSRFGFVSAIPDRAGDRTGDRGNLFRLCDKLATGPEQSHHRAACCKRGSRGGRLAGFDRYDTEMGVAGAERRAGQAASWRSATFRVFTPPTMSASPTTTMPR